MSTAFIPAAERTHPPARDPTVYAGMTGLAGVSARTSRIEVVWAEDRGVEVEVIVAVQELSEAERLELIGAGSRFHSYTVRLFHLGSAGGRPRILVLYRERYRHRIKGVRSAPLPAGLDAKSGLHVDLVGEIRRDLAEHSLAAVYRRTLAPAKQIAAIAGGLEALQWAAMVEDGFQPLFLAVDGVKVNPKTGTQRGAFHVVGCAPDEELNATLRLTAYSGKSDDKGAIKALAEAILKLPKPEKLVAIATDYGPEHTIALAAITEVQAQRPDVAPLVVVDPFHVQVGFEKSMDAYRVDRTEALKRRSKRKGKDKNNCPKVRRLKGAAKLLGRTRWRAIKDDPEKLALFNQIEEDCPEIIEAFWILEGVRQLSACRSRGEAQLRFDAWQAKVAASEIDCFDGNAEHLKKNWDKVLVLFDARQRGFALYKKWYSFGTNAVESLNKGVKWLWRHARVSSIALLEQRALARQGYIARKIATMAPTVVRRKRQDDTLPPYQAKAKKRRDKNKPRGETPAAATVSLAA